MKTIGLISANYVSEQFGELSKERSLASLPIGGRYRLIDFVLSNMANAGLTKVEIIAPYNSGSLIDHVGVGKQWSLDRKHDGLFMMPGSIYGMHGASGKFLFEDIVNNKAFFERSPNADYVLIASSSDVYNFDYNELINAHKSTGDDITVMYKHVNDAENHWGYALDINPEGKVEDFVNGAEGDADFLVDCLIINKNCLEKLINTCEPIKYLDLIEIFKKIEDLTIGTYEFKGYLGCVNSIKDYLQVCRDLFDYDIRNELFNEDRTIFTKVQDDAPVLYKPGSAVKNAIIATGCTIEGQVEESTIFRSSHIHKNAVVKNSVVMLYGDIGEGAILENVICDKFVKVAPGTKLIGTPERPIVLPKYTQI